MPTRSRPVLFLVLSILVTGVSSNQVVPDQEAFQPRVPEALPEDEIYNEGTSAPVVTSSLIRGGLSIGTIDGGGNLDADASLVDVLGADNARGSDDDDLRPTSLSPGVNAASNASLIPDRFDLDGDGNLEEPIPIDRAGNLRSYNSGGASAIADMGAFEFDAPRQTGTARGGSDAPESTLSEIYPNPADDGFTVRFLIESTSVVQLRIYDLIGREVGLVHEGMAHQGNEHKVWISTNSLASGVYFIRLNAENLELTRQFTIAR